MANWFTSMSRRERKTFWACFTGWTLDAMDVQIYAVVMPTLIVLWGMSQAEAGMLGTAALLFSSVGGWIAGILADRFGRAGFCGGPFCGSRVLPFCQVSRTPLNSCCSPAACKASALAANGPRVPC